MGFFKTIGRVAERAVATTVDIATFDLDGSTLREVKRKQRQEDEIETVKVVADFIKAFRD